ncbi:MAG: hypothetical protein HN341_00235, partial [Verrucomicrobia bacterium]|nr:hypothetical protein [Verrucomicrobiota bacterium]
MFELAKYTRYLGLMAVVAAVVSTSVAQDAIPVTGIANVSSANLRIGPKTLRDYGIEGLDNRVNLKAITDWDVVQLIEFLGIRGGLPNVVIGNGVAGLTTRLKFDDVSVGDALEVVLSVNNLAFTVQGGIITIMSDAEYRN